ncbi:hypothetical protein [Syntrophus gentianae]|nr:hypothetical protein [Syntrophus gentianae]
MELIGQLEESAQFFLGIDPPFIGTTFQPDNAVFIKVGFVDPFGDG